MMANPKRPIPFGFEADAMLPHPVLYKKYHCSGLQIRRWREELGLPRFIAGKPVLQYELDGKTFVAEYPSLHAAARAIGGNYETIQACVTGRTRKAYGYVWRWKNANNISQRELDVRPGCE